MTIYFKLFNESVVINYEKNSVLEIKDINCSGIYCKILGYFYERLFKLDAKTLNSCLVDPIS